MSSPLLSVGFTRGLDGDLAVDSAYGFDATDSVHPSSDVLQSWEGGGG